MKNKFLHYATDNKQYKYNSIVNKETYIYPYKKLSNIESSISNNKMRIAVLVYGRLDKCAEHYDNILESIGKENAIDFFLSSDNSPELRLHEFINLYKPVSYNNLPIQYNHNFQKYPGKIDNTNIDNTIRHFINKYRVFSLLEDHIDKQNVQYDVVLSLRVDLIVHNSFNFNNLENNTIYIPDCCDFRGGINDQVAYGKIDVMKKYNSVFLNIVYLLKDNISIPHPESLTYANINLYKLQIKRVDLKYIIDKY